MFLPAFARILLLLKIYDFLSKHFSKGAITIKLLKRIMAVAVTTAIMLSVTACKNEGTGAVFKYTISANPETLDPQQANELNSNIIIENVYLGLMSVNSDGAISCGAAESYTVSDDGLVYNFILRQDIYWKSVNGFEAQCTAKDFVYGFKRLFSRSVQAPRASDYYCIKNSQAVQNGEFAPSSIGVKAKSDFELEITLDYPNSRFLAMLAEPPAMPCNEEFFNTTFGKYGLSDECTASNGSFYVRQWNYDPYSEGEVNHVLLSRNSLNAESLAICPSGVNFFFNDKSEFIYDFTTGETSCVSVSNDEMQELQDGEYNCTEYCNVTAGVVFNRNFDLFKNQNFVGALTHLVNREEVASAYGQFESAEGIVPKQVLSDKEFFRDKAGAVSYSEYNPTKAQELFKAEKPNLSANLFMGARVIVSNETAKNTVSYILQEWQREFGFYCVVEQLSDSKFNARIQSGDYEIAIVELSGKYNSPSAYLEQFSSDNSANYYGFANQEFDNLMNSAEESADMEQCFEIYKQAEQLLIDECAFVPLYYKNEYFLTGEDFVDIVYNPFLKTVNFTLAKKM